MKAAQPPDQGLAERVAELAAANEALRQEIARRQLIEDDLRLREQRSREILDSLPSLISTYTSTGSVDLINQRILDYTGKTYDELLKWGMSDLVHPDDLGRAIETHRDGLASGERWDISYRMRRHDGVYRWFDAVHLPLKDSEGRITRWCISLIDIDDRTKAEEAVRIRERDLNRIINTIPTRVWSSRPDGYCDFFHRRWLDYTGSTAEEAEGWGWTDTIHTDDLAGLMEQWRAHLASGEPIDTEARIRGADGEYRWFLFRANPLRDQSGSIVRWYGTNAEIDTRKHTEDMLRRQEREAREILDNLPILVSLLEPNGDVQLVSRGALDYTGKSREELEKWGMTDLIHADDRPEVIERFRSGLASDAQHEIVFRMRRHDGAYRWFEATQTPLKDEHGTTVRWCVAVNDIDDRKRVEDMLRESEAQSRQIVENIPALVSILSPSGGFEFLNRQTLEYTGRTLEDLATWDTTDAVHPEDLQRVVKNYTTGIASAEPFQITYRMRRADGVYRWFDGYHRPMKQADGQVLRWFVTMSDIDDRKRLEDTLRASAENARSTIDGIPGLVATLEQTGAVASVNRQISEYTGCALDELKEWGTNGIVHPDDMPHVAEIFMKSIAAGTPYLIEQRIRRFDGTYRWFDNRGLPIKDQSGATTGWYVLMADIDDRRNAQDALRESEHRLQSFVDGMPGFVATLGRDGAVQSVNRRRLDYAGVPFEELQQWGSNGIVHPDDLAHVAAAFSSSMASGEPYDYEHRLRAADGTYRWFSDRGIPVLDDSGHVASWYVLIADIDDRMRSERALAESERKAQLIVDSIPGGIEVLSPTGSIEAVNDHIRRYFGKTRDDVGQWAIIDAVHPDDRERVLKASAHSIASGEPYNVENRFLGADGAYRWFQVQGLPLRDDHGQVIQWYALHIDIDERKHAEQALAESERETRLIVDTIPAGIGVLAPSGEVIGLNQHILDYFGMTYEQLKAWGSQNIVHPDDLQSVTDTMVHSLTAGVPYDTEQRLRGADGNYRWFRVRGLPLRDASGQIVRWYALHADIDDQKRVEDALRASESNLQLTIDTMPAMAWSTTPDGMADFFNKHYLDYVGLPPEQLQGTAWGATLHPEDVPGLISAWQGMVQSGEGGEAEARIRRHDGQYRWFLQRANPLRDESGKIVRWYGVNTDIEDRKNADAELRRAYDSFSDAQHLSHTGSFITDLVGDDHNWSDETYRIFEFEPKSKVSLERIQNLIHPDDLPSFGAMIGRAMQGANVDFGFRIVTSEGTTKHIRGRAHVVETVAGRPMFVGALQDATKTVVAEEALDRTRSELAHVARVTALSTLSASIAHEVSQPLSGIITNASTSLRMLAADPPNIEGARETARRTMRDGNRASEVITRLRALFSKKPTAAETVDINEAARAVIALTSSELQRNRVDVEIDLADGLPPVTGDRVQLQQVILNLLLNASDALSGIEGRPRQVTIRTEEDGDKNVQLTVADSGAGIDPENASKLFDAFYTTKDTGMGIGLSVSRSIIEHHQGRIWASANDGNGARFSFTLPPGPGRILTSAHTVTAEPQPEGGH